MSKFGTRGGVAAMGLLAVVGLAVIGLAGCAAGTSQPVAAAAAPEPPPSTEQARADCWMKTEGDKAARDLDQRVKLVEKCVNDRISGRTSK